MEAALVELVGGDEAHDLGAPSQIRSTRMSSAGTVWATADVTDAPLSLHELLEKLASPLSPDDVLLVLGQT